MRDPGRVALRGPGRGLPRQPAVRGALPAPGRQAPPGTWLFDERKITSSRIQDRRQYVEDLAEFIADKRITIEVCLTSNQQTVPEFADDLHRHPFREMQKRRLSTTFCTDNRLVSHTTVSHEVQRAIETFDLSPWEVRDILIHGFKRSFFPGTYLEKRSYVRKVIDRTDRLMRDAGLDPVRPIAMSSGA